MNDLTDAKRKKRLRRTRAELIGELEALEADYASLETKVRGSQEVLDQSCNKFGQEDSARLKQLLAENLRHRNMIEQAPIGIVEIGADGKFTSVNSAFSDMLGYDSPQDLLESMTNVAEQLYVDPTDRNKLHAQLENHGIAFIPAVEWYRKDGDTIWVSENTNVITDNSGSAIYSDCFVRDITARVKREEENRQTQALLLQASKLARIGFWIHDPQSGAMLYWSDGMTEIFGIHLPGSDEQSNIIKIDELIHHDDRSYVLVHYRNLKESGEPFDIEYRICLRNGVVKWVHEIGQGVDSGDGDYPSSIGAVQDITDQKEAEKARHESEERLQFTIKAISSGSWDWNIVTGHMIPSDSWTDVLGYEPSDIEPHIGFWETIIHPDDKKGVLASLDEFFNSDEDTYSYEYRIRHKSGEYRWFLDRGKVIEFNGSGEPVRMVGTDTDVTDRYQAESALVKSEEEKQLVQAQLMDVIEGLSEGFIWYDADDRLMIANSKAREIFDPSKFLMRVGETFETHVRYALDKGLLRVPDDQKEEWVRSRLESHRNPREPIIRQFDDGRWIQLSERRLPDSSTVCVLSDITILKNIERELRYKEHLATLGQLTATVSHELRNPLGAMRPSLYLLQKHLPTKDERLIGAFERLDRNIDRCDQIIDQMLDFTRIQVIDRQNLDLDAWLAEVLDEMVVPEGVRVKHEPGLGNKKISFDPERMRRVVINVYDNACQAMLGEASKDTESVDMQLLIKTKICNKRIEIVVRDTGPGILEDVLPRIFEPLYSTKGFGVGLGLATVRQALQQHGGDVEVLTREGRGTSMVLWLPMPEENEVVA